MEARKDEFPNLAQASFYAQRLILLTSAIQTLNDREIREKILRQWSQLWQKEIIAGMNFEDSDWRLNCFLRHEESLKTKTQRSTDEMINPFKDITLDLAEFPAAFLNLDNLASMLQKNALITKLILDPDEAPKLSANQIAQLTAIVKNSKITGITGLKRIPVESRTELDAALAANCAEAVRRQAVQRIPSMRGASGMLLGQMLRPIPEEAQAEKIFNDGYRKGK